MRAAPKSATSSFAVSVRRSPSPQATLNSAVSRNRGPPAFARDLDPGDLLAGVVEQGLPLIDGERSAGRVALGVLGVHGDVPLMARLDWVRTAARTLPARPCTEPVTYSQNPATEPP
jgi:hypothetical protein